MSTWIARCTTWHGVQQIIADGQKTVLLAEVAVYHAGNAFSLSLVKPCDQSHVQSYDLKNSVLWQCRCWAHDMAHRLCGILFVKCSTSPHEHADAEHTSESLSRASWHGCLLSPSHDLSSHLEGRCLSEPCPAMRIHDLSSHLEGRCLSEPYLDMRIRSIHKLPIGFLPMKRRSSSSNKQQAPACKAQSC